MAAEDALLGFKFAKYTLMLANSAEEVAHLVDDRVNCFSERFPTIFAPFAL